MNFSDRLKTLRIKSDLKQREIANRIGVSERVYSYYEEGRFPKNAKILSGLAKIFGVSVDYLIGNDENLKNVPPEFIIMARKIDKLPNNFKELAYRLLDDTANNIIGSIKIGIGVPIDEEIDLGEIKEGSGERFIDFWKPVLELSDQGQDEEANAILDSRRRKLEQEKIAKGKVKDETDKP